ncbi:MAG: Wzz/FepE/Etk N-terminal domain-containing protein [Chloroflexota bacterium]|nr:Wzz/FepE/Etk N-terminal domain-containing protein [Chloroflexota bacterium]
MRPEVYLRVLRRGWWVIALAALIAGVIGYASQVGKPKTYEASTRLAVTSLPIDYFSDQLTANWTQALEPYVHNPNTVQSAVDKGYLQPGDAAFAYNAVTRSNRDNRTVTIALTDQNPARAARVVGALAHIVVDKNKDDIAASDAEDKRLSQSAQQNAVRTPRLVVTSLDCAAPSGGLFSPAVLPNCPSPPATPNGPRTKLTALAGLVLGAVLGLIVVMGAAALDDSLKGQDDVQHYLHVPVIATIPRRRANR